jgi:hypothetical protein
MWKPKIGGHGYLAVWHCQRPYNIKSPFRFQSGQGFMQQKREHGETA